MSKIKVDDCAVMVWGDYWENYRMGPERTQFLRKKTELANCSAVKNSDSVEQYSVLSMVASYIDDCMEVAFNLGWEERDRERLKLGRGICVRCGVKVEGRKRFCEPCKRERVSISAKERYIFRKQAEAKK